MSQSEPPLATPMSPLKMAVALLAICFACTLAIVAQADAPPPAPSRHSDSQQIIQHDGGSPYALVQRGHDNVLVSSGGSRPAQLDQVKKSVGGDFVWFRDDGKSYVIQDPALLARAFAAWQPMEKLSAEMSAYSKVMSEHSKVMGELGKKMALTRQGAPDAQSAETVGRQMEAQGKSMDALGKQMDVLGKQQEAVSKQADRTMRALMQEALKNGKAVPAPADA